MAPTEPSILSNFLLPPAPLSSILSFQEFKSLFPRSDRHSTRDLQTLYRELEHQKALAVDLVRRNIVAEAQRGERMRRHLARSRRRAPVAHMDGVEERDLRMELELPDSTMANPHVSKPHSLGTLKKELEFAQEDLDEEIDALEKEAAELLQDIRSTVGNLSDLRYGKFSQVAGVGSELGQEVVDGMRTLEQACTDAIGHHEAKVG